MLLTGWPDMNDFLFHDDDDLPNGSELRKRAAGTMMEVKAEYKKKKSNGEDTEGTGVKDWVPPSVMTEFEDHNKQKT